MSLPPFDFQNPCYAPIIKQRMDMLAEINRNPSILPDLKLYYKLHPWQFVIDWGCTIDPRNTAKKRPSVVPFILFPKQVEMMRWLYKYWKEEEGGLLEKSREMGATWVTVAFSVALCLFNKNIIVGFGSRKEKNVDIKGSSTPIFGKIRDFINRLPRQFLASYDAKNSSLNKYMHIEFPDTCSFIEGESGTNMGRGGRYSLYFVDESAFLPDSDATKNALSAATDARFDISTPNGTNNYFYERRNNKDTSVFTFHWRDDPRKSQAWYDQKCRTLDPVTVAQELDIDYMAAVHNLVLEQKWVQACVDAHIKLKITPSGTKVYGFDVADVGADNNALVLKHGVVATAVEEWSGKDLDIYTSVSTVISKASAQSIPRVIYDADGLGAGVRGDATSLMKKVRYPIQFIAFKGSKRPQYPYKKEFSNTRNDGYFCNLKAQMWWLLRQRMLLTYRILHNEQPLQGNEDKIISISSECSNLSKLTRELSQPCFEINEAGKFKIDKAPKGSRSPNLADAFMIAFSRLDPRTISV